ncbi:MAG: alpha/beta hydrolase [Bdellovibrionales bacterium]
MIQRPPETFSEEPFAIPTPDGKKIYGTLYRSKTPNGSVVILSHGIMGSAHEYIHMMARNAMTQNGYDVVCFYYYVYGEAARSLRECTVETHQQDLRQICDHFRSSHQKLYVAGHSYGGRTLMLANPEAHAFAFWDSSFAISKDFWPDRAGDLPGTPYATLHGSSYHLIDPQMIELDRKIDDSDLSDRIRQIKAPSLVAIAEESVNSTTRSELFHTLSCEKKYVEIAGANHLFSKGNSVFDLLETTLDWFNLH